MPRRAHAVPSLTIGLHSVPRVEHCDLAIELPELIRVYLNGELVLELAAGCMPSAVEQRMTHDHGEHALVAQAVEQALAVDGPFSLQANTDEAGLQVFAEYKRGKARFSKSIRSLSLGAHLFSPCDVWTEHVAHGAWRCQNERGCKPFEPIPGVKENPPGLRNAPDAEVCVYCSAKQLPSEEPPEPNPMADHPGLWIVTSRTFKSWWLSPNATSSCSCQPTGAPSKAMKPAWYQLAQILANNPDVKVGLLDSDKNRTDPQYIWEGSIPTMKLFVKGKKRQPCLRGRARASAWIRFICNTVLSWVRARPAGPVECIRHEA